ncbi:hypothetical protein E3N88_28523 [Mikania micrantha]|uniref:Uncharacterized protein n=1 Tax=Mikania micrantha TaxID=192012 RepID=A0A5N6N2N1_9ASTR|nr:hypothetical protein E3N88_28523 [Mikania micrantha]
MKVGDGVGKCLETGVESDGGVLSLVETSGGVASPGSSGSLQCDLYRFEHVSVPYAQNILVLKKEIGLASSKTPFVPSPLRSPYAIFANGYGPFRLPSILVGDGRLGGISGTISAYESLTIRGYDVVAVVLEDHGLENEVPLLSY